MSGDLEKTCVLVVDDDEDIRETLREAIEMVGCTAILAENGADGLKKLSERRPCLIILDLLMPVMTGEEMLDEMRKKPELANFPVIVSTSAPNRAPAGVPVLPKPIDLSTFWKTIRRSCSCDGHAPAQHELQAGH
jgi:CheY-like chemotaxis protein